MSNNSSTELDEAQPLPTFHASLSVGTFEVSNDPHGEVVSSLCPPCSIESKSEGHRGRENALPACSLIGAHQQRLAIISYQRQSYTADNRSQKLWLWEALSITTAVLAFAAIVVTLVIYKDKLLPRWPSQITINSLISVFTSIFKVSLMMPIAEGIGQLRWLCRVVHFFFISIKTFPNCLFPSKVSLPWHGSSDT